MRDNDPGVSAGSIDEPGDTSIDAVGVVTAAGQSTRMGGFPKPLLHLGDDRFVERVVGRLAAAGVRETFVVLGHEYEEVRKRVSLPDATLVDNPDYGSGMLSSVRIGVDHAIERDADALLLWPVDYPCAPATAVTALMERYSENHADVVVPTYDGDRGHPALFGADTFEPLRSAPEDAGARAVVYDDATDVVEVPVDEPGVLVDIDTPGEYWDAVRRFE